MKRLLSLVLAATFLFALLPAAHAAPNGSVEVSVYDRVQVLPVVKMELDGRVLSGGIPAVILSGRTMAPARLLAEALGAAVTWHPAAGQVTVRAGETTILLTLGSPTAYINGVARTLPDGVPATLMTYRGQGYTMVPLRFLAEALGGQVTWDQGRYAASVSRRGNALDTPIDPGRFLIALDAGHGGSASGAYYEGTAEKDLNLAMTLRLWDILNSLGYRTILTRSTDVYVGLGERAEMANRAGADLFISIHCNASVTSNTFQGLHVYHFPGSRTGSALAQAIQTPACRFTGAIDRGIASDNFAVLRETNMPAALVETGYMTCHEELMRLRDPVYQDKMARGIAQGIIQYLNGR